MLKATFLFVVLLAYSPLSLGQDAPTAENVGDIAERDGTHATESITQAVDAIIDGIGSSTATPAGDGFQYTNIRLETSTPLSMIESAEAAATDAGSWTDRLKPWKNKGSPVDVPMPGVSGVSGVSGNAGILSAYEGEPIPPVNPQSEAEILLAKQQLLMALLDDTEEALAAQRG